jgi:hypothetical protein
MCINIALNKQESCVQLNHTHVLPFRLDETVVFSSPFLEIGHLVILSFFEVVKFRESVIKNQLFHWKIFSALKYCTTKVPTLNESKISQFVKCHRDEGDNAFMFPLNYKLATRSSLFSNTWNLCSILKISSHTSHPYKTSCKMSAMY